MWWKDTYDSGASSLAMLGSVGPNNDRQPSTASSFDKTINNVGPLIKRKEKGLSLQ